VAASYKAEYPDYCLKKQTTFEEATMHNIDRTQLESSFPELSPEYLETSEYGQEIYAGEAGPSFYETPFQEIPLSEAPLQEIPFQETGLYEVPMSEALETELAAELLEITNEQELDQFLGKMFKRVGGGIGRFARSSAGRALGGVLKNVAKKALPIAGTAIGGFFGGPAGAAIGGKLLPMAGKIFGLELEGLSGEDREFEVARRFVRMSGDAMRRAAVSRPTEDPIKTARGAVVAAARRHAPGLLSAASPGQGALSVSSAMGGPSGRSGRWVRRGNRIVIFGV
jgi:hypothetical protein